MAGPHRGRNRGRLRHIRNMLAISSRLPRQCLLRLWRLIIGRAWGRPTCLVHKYRESLEDLPRLNRWDGTVAAALGSSAGVPGPCAGRAYMATALVDLYGGDDFEPFDRLILAEGYSPSADEEFMCAKHRAYFLRKLKGWKEAIIEESRAT